MKELKVTIFGSYNKNSIGDKAILISLLDLLFRHKKFNLTVDVLVFEPDAITDDIKEYPWRDRVKIIPVIKEINEIRNSKNFSKKKILFNNFPNFIKTLLGFFIFKKISQPYDAKRSNALIIGGGNLLMDIYPSWPGRPLLIQRRFLKRGKPTYLLGVGAFPIKNFLSKYMLKRIAKNAKKIFVRDHLTKDFIKKNWDNRAEWAPDLAFSFPLHSVSFQNKSRLKCAINIAPIYGENWPIKDPEKYKNFIDEISKQLFQYYTKSPQVTLLFFDTNYPTDSVASKTVIKKLKKLGVPHENIEYEDRLHTCKGICSKLSEANVVLTTRLHASILALRLKKPILSIKYQTKVYDVLKSVGIDENNIIDLNELDKICEKLEKLPSRKASSLTGEKIKELDKLNYNTTKSILEDIST